MKQNWTIEVAVPEAENNLLKWGTLNTIKIDLISRKVEYNRSKIPSDISRVEANYIVSMTKEDATSMKLSVPEIIIKRAKW